MQLQMKKERDKSFRTCLVCIINQNVLCWHFRLILVEGANCVTVDCGNLNFISYEDITWVKWGTGAFDQASFSHSSFGFDRFCFANLQFSQTPPLMLVYILECRHLTKLSYTIHFRRGERKVGIIFISEYHCLIEYRPYYYISAIRLDLSS